MHTEAPAKRYWDDLSEQYLRQYDLALDMAYKVITLTAEIKTHEEDATHYQSLDKQEELRSYKADYRRTLKSLEDLIPPRSAFETAQE